MKEQTTEPAPSTELVTNNGLRSTDQIMADLHANGTLSARELAQFLQGEETTIELEGDDQD